MNVASRANVVREFQNIKIKLHKTILHIKFNKSCLKYGVIPNYAVVHIKCSCVADRKTKKHAEVFRIKEELKSLYIKKASLNSKLYKIHLRLLNNTHPAALDSYLDFVNRDIKQVTYRMRITQANKLQSLMNSQLQRIENIKCKQTFYPRLQNLTSVDLNSDETELLNKGLMYNLPLHTSNFSRNHITAEGLNAETFVKAIPEQQDQDKMRFLINEKFNKVIARKNNNSILPAFSTNYNKERKTLVKLKKKLSDNHALVTKADKGNTVVIIDVNTYNEKIQDFIIANNIVKLVSDPTKHYIKSLNQCINRCTHLFDERTRRSLKPINAKAPVLTGLPKLHKENIPIRPLVNFTTAPGYKTAKRLVNVIKQNILLHNNYSLIDSTDFVDRVKNINIEPSYKLASLDIVNLYTNIPITETIQILRNNLIVTKKLDIESIHELIDLLQLLLDQNYFTHDNLYFSQREGLAMGSPLSGLLADVYLNNFENSYIFENNMHSGNIIFYGRYVDDTFLIYKGTQRQIDRLHSYLNSINSHMRFTLEHEVKGQLNFLDLSITKNTSNKKLHFNIYRKPTTTDTVIHATSFHPISQKMAAFHSMIHRLLSLPLDNKNFLDELHTIKYIAVANGYSATVVSSILKKHRNRRGNINQLTKTAQEKKTQTYITATYTNFIPKILKSLVNKNSGIVVTYKTTNNILNNLRTRDSICLENRTGVYKLSCSDCDGFYVGQTGRGFLSRFKEHKPPTFYRNFDAIKSNFAKHLVNENHSYNDFRTNLKPLHFCSKGRYMNTLEEFEIYKAFRDNSTKPHVLNDQLLFKSNVLYDTALKYRDNKNQA
jgi:hypothetical protein